MARRKLPTKPHKRSSTQFVPIPYDMLKHPNFRRLSPDAVRVWLEMHLGYHGINNGEIGFSVQKAMYCLHGGSGRASKSIDELIEARFIICTRDSSFNMKTKRAREWMLTTQPMGMGAASNEWKKITVPPE